MAKWTKIEDCVLNVSLPLTVSDVTTVSSKFINTRDNDTMFFRWNIENTETGTDTMTFTVNLTSSYAGEFITLATTNKTIAPGSTDEIIVQFSPNVPGGTVASSEERIQLGMGNPNYLGENTFSTIQFSNVDSTTGNNGAGKAKGKVNAVECFLMAED